MKSEYNNEFSLNIEGIDVKVSGVIVFEKYTCPNCEWEFNQYECEDLGFPEVVVCKECGYNMKSIENSEGMLSFETSADTEELELKGLTKENIDDKVGNVLVKALENAVKENKRCECKNCECEKENS